MDRRSFLKGTFGGIAAGGIIIAATDADIATFASVTPEGKEVDIAPLLQPGAWAQVNDYVYNERGHIIGLVKHVQFDRQMIDVSRWQDSHLNMMAAGPMSVTYTVQADGFMPLVPLTHERTR